MGEKNDYITDFRLYYCTALNLQGGWFSASVAALLNPTTKISIKYISNISLTPIKSIYYQYIKNWTSFISKRNKVLISYKVLVNQRRTGKSCILISNNRGDTCLESRGGADSSRSGGDGEEEIRYRQIGGLNPSPVLL